MGLIPKPNNSCNALSKESNPADISPAASLVFFLMCLTNFSFSSAIVSYNSLFLSNSSCSAEMLSSMASMRVSCSIILASTSSLFNPAMTSSCSTISFLKKVILFELTLNSSINSFTSLNPFGKSFESICAS